MEAEVRDDDLSLKVRHEKQSEDERVADLSPVQFARTDIGPERGVGRIAQDAPQHRRHEQVVNHTLHFLAVILDLIESLGLEESFEERALAVADRQRVLALA
ncbi:hypothetical protein ACQR16_10140 [Bradyrhizobium oligotrophicum]|uniref:hypothetical protein n=1 Tax=Bradyrhizobium oligotrophicum TaxID=44255 RepID=UPI003EBD4151